MQGRGHGRYEPTRDAHCRLPTKKSFLPARVRGQDLLFHHRFMEQEASSSLASLAYRNIISSSSQGVKVANIISSSKQGVKVSRSSIPHSSSPQTPTSQGQGMQPENIIPLQ